MTERITDRKAFEQPNALESGPEARPDPRNDDTPVRRRSNAAMDRENWLRWLFDAIDDEIFIHDHEGRILDCNASACRRLGYMREELLQLHTADIDAPEFAVGFKDRLQKQETEGNLCCEGIHVTKDGRRIPVDINTSLINYHGRPAVLAVMRDITGHKQVEQKLRRMVDELAKTNNMLEREIAERRRVEEALAKERDLLQAFMDTSPDLIFFKDRQSRFLRANRVQAALLNIENPAEIVGRTDFDFFPKADAQRFYDDEQRIMETGEPVIGREWQVLWADGRIHWMAEHKVPVRDATGEVVGLFGISRDVTAHKQAEEQLAFERDLLHALMDNIPDTIYFKDTESRFIRINKAQAEWAGLSDPSEAIGKTDFDFFEATCAKESFEDEQRILQTAQPLMNKLEMISSPTGRRWFTASKVPLRDKQGNMMGLVGISHDVTQIKQMEEALAFERDLLHGLMDNIPDTIYFKDTQSRFIRINKAQANLAGLTDPTEAIGKTDFDLFDAGCARESFEDEQRIFQTGQPLTNKVEINAGPTGRHWMTSTKVPIRDQQGHIVSLVGISHDVTPIKQMEEALAFERDLLQALMDNMPDTIYFKDAQSRFIRINKAQVKVLGLNSPDEAIGKSDFDFMEEEFARQAFDDEQRLLRNNEPMVDKVEKVLTKSAGARWVTATKVPIVDKDGRVTGLVGMSRNITDRVMAEMALKERTEALERSNKELVEFAYIASHDLQEPLRMVSSFTQLLARRYTGKLDSTANEFIQFAVDGAKRMQRLLNDLLTYSRVTTKARPLEPTEANTVLQQALENLHMAIDEANASIRQDPLPRVMADETQFIQLFQNLLGNALKFRRDEPLHIHVSARRDDGHWLFSIQDNGIGIPPESTERVFQIFQRAHSNGNYPGTGIGLAICKKIVERHGGRIWLESQVGSGTTFYFTLPAEDPS
jgi:PAS domain S-box-containing protein